MAVQRVGRLEHGDRAAVPAVGEAQRLQHLVRAVGREHLARRRRRAARRSRRAARWRPGRGSGASRRATARRRARRATPAGGGYGRLVGVEPDLDVDLGRVVALHERRGRRAAGTRLIAAVRSTRGRRMRTDSAWASRPSAVGERARRAGATWPSAASSSVDDVHVLREVGDGERAGEAGRAVRGQHVARAGDVVADRGRRPRAAEHRAGVAHQRDAAPRGRRVISSRCSGAIEVGDRHRLLGPVDEHQRSRPGARVASMSAAAGRTRRRGGRSRRRWRRRASSTR